MDKQKMMKYVKVVFLERLNSDFSLELSERLWPEIFAGQTEISDNEDMAAAVLFNQCFDELHGKVVAAFKT